MIYQALEYNTLVVHLDSSLFLPSLNRRRDPVLGFGRIIFGAGVKCGLGHEGRDIDSATS